MRKRDLRYFWSHFQALKNEKQIAFVHKDNKWKAYTISKNETNNSGRLDVTRIAELSSSLAGGTVYIVHNHPNQTPNPSNPDRFQYAYIQSILSLCGIDVYDYLIMSPYGYFSFREAGFLVENKPSFQTPTKAIPIEMPSITLRMYMSKHQKEIFELSKMYGEMIFNNQYQYGTEKEFNGSFLLRNERKLCNKHIFIKRKKSKDDVDRLNHIDRVIDPIDIYLIENDSLISVKTQCRIC